MLTHRYAAYQPYLDTCSITCAQPPVGHHPPTAGASAIVESSANGGGSGMTEVGVGEGWVGEGAVANGVKHEEMAAKGDVAVANGEVSVANGMLPGGGHAKPKPTPPEVRAECRVLGWGC